MISLTFHKFGIPIALTISDCCSVFHAPIALFISFKLIGGLGVSSLKPVGSNPLVKDIDIYAPLVLSNIRS